MNCNKNCKLCNNLIISTAVAFAGDVLTITIPEGSYANGCKYCLVIAQTIPTATTIGATVEIAIGNGTETYSLVRCDGLPVLAAALRTRTRYPMIVSTNATGGVFRVKGNLCCAAYYPLAALTGDPVTAEGGA